MGKIAGTVVIFPDKNTMRIPLKDIEYKDAGESGIDLVAPLWYKLNEHHKVHSPHFPEHHSRMTWEKRKENLLEKSRNGAIYVDLVKDIKTGALIGYCVSTISEKRQGEIDSIYIEEEYRRCGIGDNLIKRALSWFKDRSVTEKMIEVAAGNEEVLPFYSRYNFYPRSFILKHRGDDKAGK